MHASTFTPPPSGAQIKMPLPPKSLQGDVELQLDSGERMRVHSLLLELASTVLADALKVQLTVTPANAYLTALLRCAFCVCI